MEIWLLGIWLLNILLGNKWLYMMIWKCSINGGTQKNKFTIVYNGKILIKMANWGYPHLWKHPNQHHGHSNPLEKVNKNRLKSWKRDEEGSPWTNMAISPCRSWKCPTMINGRSCNSFQQFSHRWVYTCRGANRYRPLPTMVADFWQGHV